MLNTPENNKLFALNKITDLYRIALFCYLISFIFIVLLHLNMNTFHAKGMILFALFFLSTFTLVIIGLISNILGLKLSHKMNHIQKNDIGYRYLIAGIINFMLALFGLKLVYTYEFLTNTH